MFPNRSGRRLIKLEDCDYWDLGGQIASGQVDRATAVKSAQTCTLPMKNAKKVNDDLMRLSSSAVFRNPYGASGTFYQPTQVQRRLVGKGT